MSKRLSPLDLFLLIAPPLFWAGNFVIGRIVREDIGPVSLAFWRWVIAFCCILPFAYPHIKRDWRRYFEHKRLVLLTSIIGVASFNTLVYWGVHYTTATNALLFNSTIPLLIILFGAIFYKQRPHRMQQIGLAFSFIGVLAIILEGRPEALLQFSFNRGDLIVFTAMICWAAYTLWMKQIPADISRVGLTGVHIGITVLVLIPLWLWESGGNLPTGFNQRAIMALLYVGIFPSVIAYLGYNLAVQRVGPVISGLFIHLMPVFGIILATLFANEVLQLYHVIGIILIAMGLTLSSRS